MRKSTRIPVNVRLWRRVEKRADGCWVWNGARNKQGYGEIGLGGKRSPLRKTHRVAWELEHGPIPAGMFVMHTCDNPPCVNPAHLSLGTHLENMADMVAKGRARSLEGIENRNAKFPRDVIDEVLRRAAAGESQCSVSRALGISQPYISQLVRGESRRRA